MKLSTRLNLAVAIALFAASTLAVAQTSPAEFAQTKDQASRMLDILFGQPNGSGPAGALGAALNVFNTAALAFGTLLFTYMVIVGTMRSAEDGELLGKKWSSMWIPLRFTLAAALMVPLASGYSTAQAGMLWLAKAGSGLATEVWSASAQRIIGEGESVGAKLIAMERGGKVDSAIRTIWRAEACVEAFRQRFGYSAADFGIALSEKHRDGSYRITWGSKNANVTRSPDACGSLATAGYSPPEPTAFNAVDSLGNATQILEPDTVASNVAAFAAVPDAQAAGTMEAARVISLAVTPIVQPCGAATQPACLANEDSRVLISSAVSRANDVFTARVTPALQAAYYGNEQQLLIKRSVEPGWVMAGTSMYSLARIQSQSNATKSWAPEVTAPDAATRPSKHYEQAMDEWMAYDVYQASWGNPLANPTAAEPLQSTGLTITRVLARVVGGDPSSEKHMILQVKENGDYLMGATEGALLVLGTAQSAVGGVVSSGASIATGVVGSIAFSALNNILKLGFYAVIPLFIVGIMMSLVLPTLPFMLWVGSVMGWFVAVAEAIIAVPVWLAAHLHPDGDDLTGKGTNGYMIVVEVLLRPTFMVLGLIMALAISDLMMRWVSQAYWVSVDEVQVGSTTGIVSAVVICILYVGLMWTVMRTAFGLVHDIPATILRWIGGQNATHDKGAEFGGTYTNQANQGLGRAENAVISSIGSIKSRGPGPGLARKPKTSSENGGELGPGEDRDA